MYDWVLNTPLMTNISKPLPTTIKLLGRNNQNNTELLLQNGLTIKAGLNRDHFHKDSHHQKPSTHHDQDLNRCRT